MITPLVPVVRYIDLEEWTEVVGVLLKIEQESGFISLTILDSGINVYYILTFPINSRAGEILQKSLTDNLIGSPIAIIRTDLERQPVIVLVVGQTKGK